MAFHVPAQAAYQSYSRTEQLSTLEIPLAPQQQQQQQDDETREWVLFSPSQGHSATRSLTSSTSRTPRTAALSQWSDFGPLESGNRSIGEDHDNDSLDEVLEDEGTDLDSLDDGLHAFRESSLARPSPGGLDHGHPVLPTHDGLGSFHFSRQDVQEQLWQHERLNPRRTQAPSPSIEQSHQEAVAKLENDEAKWDRWQRIEKWRMEQSRVLLQEIERETTRLQRRKSRASRTSDRASALHTGTDVMSSIPETSNLSDASSSHTDTSSTAGDSDPDISFWRRITRKVIRDLIGIDNTLLSVILGESLPEEGQDSPSKSDVRETRGADQEMMDPNRDDGTALWQTRLLQRIARELGVLVHQLFESPGAFSSYPLASQSMSDRSTGPSFSPLEKGVRSKLLSKSPHPDSVAGLSSNPSLHFSPTLRGLVGEEYAAHWGIEDHPVQTAAKNPTTGLGTSAEHLEHSASDEHFSELANLQREHEYWERELDVTMVFRYLRNRFSPGEKNNLNPASSRHTTPTQCPQDLSRRAAIIRHHHPLVARAHARSQAQLQRHLKVHTQSSSGSISAAASPSSPIARYRFRRQSSSCASQSTKNTNRTLAGIGSNSSRNYWDVSGSVGSNSPVSVGGAAGVGAWGEM
jgi:hypothetical protein